MEEDHGQHGHGSQSIDFGSVDGRHLRWRCGWNRWRSLQFKDGFPTAGCSSAYVLVEPSWICDSRRNFSTGSARGQGLQKDTTVDDDAVCRNTRCILPNS